MSQERDRWEFMFQRDGLELALVFAEQVFKSYRSAVLQSRKRGHSKPHHASLPEYRKGFIKSHLFYKQILTEYNRL